MQGKANILKHPLHLILIPFPVAFWTGALVTDVAGSVTGDPFWFRMSVVELAMGTIVAVVASLCGYIDYRTVRLSAKAASVARGHLWWSLATLAVFVIAWALRAHDPGWRPGIVVTALGALLLLIAAYLGSELANRHGVGFLPRPNEGAAELSDRV